MASHHTSIQCQPKGRLDVEQLEDGYFYEPIMKTSTHIRSSALVFASVYLTKGIFVLYIGSDSPGTVKRGFLVLEIVY